MADNLTTCILLTQTTTVPVPDGGTRLALDEVEAVRDAFILTAGDGGTGSHWVAGFLPDWIASQGQTPTPTGDSAAVVDEGQINLLGTRYRILIGTATTPALQALVAAVGANRVFDGVQVINRQPLLALLRARTNPRTGRRRCPSLRRKDNNAEVSLVAPTGVAGHDRIAAALPPGLQRADVEVDDA